MLDFDLVPLPSRDGIPPMPCADGCNESICEVRLLQIFCCKFRQESYSSFSVSWRYRRSYGCSKRWHYDHARYVVPL